MSRSLPLARLIAVALLVAVVVSASAALPGRAQSISGTGSQPLVVASTIPTQVFPTADVPIKRIIYIWTAVSGATQYQLQVYQDATLILNQNYTSSVCVSGTCSVRHDVDLANAAYIWRVRAYVAGWQTYSAWQAFSVTVEAPPATGFYSPFTSNALDWVMHRGLWYLESSNYFTTVGVAGKASSISHLNDYTTLTYEVRMKRIGCNGCANTIAIRGNPTLDVTGWWNTEYTFDYTNTGLFSVWRDYYGTYTALRNWTSTTAINQGGWNVLTVTANGSVMNFYINGHLVWSGIDDSYPSGRVGIGMYRNTTSTGNKLYVDYAQLDTTAPLAPVMNQAIEAGDEVPGGDRNMAP